MTTTSFAITQLLSDISVVRSYWSICSLSTDSDNTNLLIRPLTAVLWTSILLHITNIAWPHDGVYLVTAHKKFSDVTAPYLYKPEWRNQKSVLTSACKCFVVVWIPIEVGHTLTLDGARSRGLAVSRTIQTCTVAR